MAEGPDVAVNIIPCCLMPLYVPHVVSSYCKEPVNVCMGEAQCPEHRAEEELPLRKISSMT